MARSRPGCQPRARHVTWPFGHFRFAGLPILAEPDIARPELFLHDYHH